MPESRSRKKPAYIPPPKAAGPVVNPTWLVPVMLVLGWVAGMCNEHTGPTAMVAMAAFVWIRRRQLRAWMIAGMVGLYVGYPMLFFAPGQAVRYGGLATKETPARLLAERGVTGCLEILVQFVWESRLGILLFAAAFVRYVVIAGMPAIARETHRTAALLIAASLAIVVTLFVSPTTTDRVMFASGVLLVGFVAAALALVRSGYDAGRQRFPYSLGDRLPEFNALERLTFRVHAFAFPIWTFAIICGAIWAEAAWGRYWGWDPKETWSFVAWVIYAGYLHARATPSVKRTVATWIAVLGWVAMMVNLFGVNLVISGLHSYAGVK